MHDTTPRSISTRPGNRYGVATECDTERRKGQMLASSCLPAGYRAERMARVLMQRWRRRTRLVRRPEALEGRRLTAQVVGVS